VKKRLPTLGGVARGLTTLYRAQRVYGTRGAISFARTLLPSPGSRRERAVDLGRGKLFLRPGTTDLANLREVFFEGSYDLDKFTHSSRAHTFYRRLLAAGKRPFILDCGAYIGLSARYLADVFPDADIVAVEPSLVNYRMLEKNVAGRSRIRPVHAAIGRSEAFVKIDNPAHPKFVGFTVSTCSSTDPEAIQSLSVSDLLPSDGERVPFIVKLDVQGAERDVFASPEWLARVPIVLIELHDWRYPWEGRSASFLSAVAQHPVEVLLNGQNLAVFNRDLLGPELDAPAAA